MATRWKSCEECRKVRAILKQARRLGRVLPNVRIRGVAKKAFVHLDGVVDVGAERARLQKEIDKARKETSFLEGKLGRPDFVERAPAEVVARDRERLTEQGQILEKLTASLAALK